MKRKLLGWFVAVAALGAGVLFVAGGAMSKSPTVGDPAPDFTLIGSDGETYSLEQFRGVRPVVLAWFPKSSTPG